MVQDTEEEKKRKLKAIGDKWRRNAQLRNATPPPTQGGQYNPYLEQQMNQGNSNIEWRNGTPYITERTDAIKQSPIVQKKKEEEIRSHPDFQATVQTINARESYVDRKKAYDDALQKYLDKNQDARLTDTGLAVNIAVNGYQNILNTKDTDVSLQGFKAQNQFLGDYYNDIMNASKNLLQSQEAQRKKDNFDFANNIGVDGTSKDAYKLKTKVNTLDELTTQKGVKAPTNILKGINTAQADETGDDTYIREAVLDNTASKYLSGDQLKFYQGLQTVGEKAKFLAITANQAAGGVTSWTKSYREKLAQNPFHPEDINTIEDVKKAYENGRNPIDTVGGIAATLVFDTLGQVLGAAGNSIDHLGYSAAHAADDALGSHLWTRLWTGRNENDEAVDKAQQSLIDYANNVTKEEREAVEANLDPKVKQQMIQAAKAQAAQNSAIYNYFKNDKSKLNYSDQDWLNMAVDAYITAKYTGDANQATKFITDKIQNDVASNWKWTDSVASGANQFVDNAVADILGMASLAEAGWRMGENALYWHQPISFETAMANSNTLKWANGVQTMGGYMHGTGSIAATIGNIIDLATGNTQVNGQKYDVKGWDNLGYVFGWSQAAEMERRNLESQRNGGPGVWNPDAQVYKVGEENDFFNGNLLGSLTDAFGQYGFTVASTILSGGTSSVAKSIATGVAKSVSKGILKGTSKEYLNAVVHQMEKQGIKSATKLTAESILKNTSSKQARKEFVDDLLKNVSEAQRTTIKEQAQKEAMDQAIKASRARFIRGQQIATGLVGTSEGALEAINTYDESMTNFIQEAKDAWTAKHSQQPFDDNPNNSLEGRISEDITKNHQDEIDAKVLEDRTKDILAARQSGDITDQERQIALQELVQDRMDSEMAKDPLFQDQVMAAHNHAMIGFTTNFWANSAINGMLDCTMKLSSMSKTAREALNKRKGLLKNLTMEKADKGFKVGIKEDAGKWWTQAAKITKSALKNAGGEGLEEVAQDVTNAASQGFANTFYSGYLGASYNSDSRDVVNGTIIGTVLNGIKGGYLTTALATGLSDGIEELSKQDTWKDGLYGFLGAGLGGPSINFKAASSVLKGVKTAYKEGDLHAGVKSIKGDLSAEIDKAKKDYHDSKGFVNKIASAINSFNSISPITYRSSITQAFQDAKEDSQILQDIKNNVNNIINTDEAEQILTYLPTQVSFMQMLDQQTESGDEIGVHDSKAMIATLNSLIMQSIGEGSDYVNTRNDTLNARIGWQNNLFFDEDGHLKNYDQLTDDEKQKVSQSEAFKDNNSDAVQSEESLADAYNQTVQSANITLETFKNSDNVGTSMTDKQAVDRMAKSAQQQLDFDAKVKDLSAKYDNMFGDSPLDFETKAALISGDIMFDEWTRRAQDIDSQLNSLKGEFGEGESEISPDEQNRNTVVSQYGSVEAFNASQDRLSKAISTQEAIVNSTTDDDLKQRAQEKLDSLKQAQAQSRVLKDSIDNLTNQRQEASDNIAKLQTQLQAQRDTLAQFDTQKVDNIDGQTKAQVKVSIAALEKQLDDAKKESSKEVDRVLTEREILSLSEKDRAAMIAHKDDKKLYSQEQRDIINNLIAKANETLNANADEFHQDKNIFENMVKDVNTLRQNMNQLSYERAQYVQHPEIIANAGAVLRQKEAQRNIEIENRDLLNSNNFDSYKDQEDAINRKIAQYDQEDGIPQNSGQHSQKANILRRLSIGNRKDDINNGYKKYYRAKLQLKLVLGSINRKKLDFTNPNVLRAIASIYAIISESKNQGYSQAAFDVYKILSQGGQIERNALSENILSAIENILKSGEFKDYLKNSDIIPEIARTSQVETLENQLANTEESVSLDDIDKIKQLAQDILGLGISQMNRDESNKQVKKPQVQSTSKTESKSATQPKATRAPESTPQEQRDQRERENRLVGDDLNGSYASIPLATIKALYPNDFEYLNSYFGMQDFLLNYDNTNQLNGKKPKFQVVKMNIGNRCYLMVVAYDPQQRGSRGLAIDGARYKPIAVLNVEQSNDPTITEGIFRLAKDNKGNPYTVNLTSISPRKSTNNGKLDDNQHYSVWHTEVYDPKKPFISTIVFPEIIHKFIKNITINPKFNPLGQGVERFQFLWYNWGLKIEQNVNKLSVQGKSLLQYIKDALNGQMLGEEGQLPLIQNILSVIKNNGDNVASMLPDPSNVDSIQFLKNLFTFERKRASDGGTTKVPLFYFGGQLASKFDDEVNLQYHSQTVDNPNWYWTLTIGDKTWNLGQGKLSQQDMLDIIDTLASKNMLMLDNESLNRQLKHYVSQKDSNGIPKGITSNDWGLKIIAGFMAVGAIQTPPTENQVEDRPTTFSVQGSNSEAFKPETKETLHSTSDNPMDDEQQEPIGEKAQNAINKALAKARRIVAQIKQDASKLKLRHPNDDHYEDENSNKYNRVTTLEAFLKGFLISQWSGSPFEKQSQGIGNSYDITMRYALEYLENNFTNPDGTRRPVDILNDQKTVFDIVAKKLNIEYDKGDAFKTWGNFTENARLEVIAQAMTFYNYCVRMGWHTVTSGISASGLIKTTSGKQLRINGTLDILVYDNEGKFRIIDMKTIRHSTIGAASREKFSDSIERNRPKWTAQLNLYKQLLSQKYPDIEWADDSLYILPCAVEYDQFGNNKEVRIDDQRRGENEEYEPTNQVYYTTVINGRRSKEKKFSINAQSLSPLTERTKTTSIQDLLVPIDISTEELVVDDSKLDKSNTTIYDDDQSTNNSSPSTSQDTTQDDSTQDLGTPVVNPDQDFTDENTDQPTGNVDLGSQEETSQEEEKPQGSTTSSSELEDFNTTKERQQQQDDESDDEDDDDWLGSADDLQREEGNYTLANRILRRVRYTFRKKSTGYSEPMSPRKKRKFIKQFIKETTIRQLNQLLGTTDRDVFNITKISVDKLISNPQRYVPMFVRRLAQYYNNISQSDSNARRQLKFLATQNEILYDIIHSNITQDEVIQRLSQDNISLDQCVILMQYYQSDDTGKKSIVDDFNKKYSTKEDISKDLKDQNESLGNYTSQINDVLEVLQSPTINNVLTSKLINLQNDIKSSFEASGVKNYNDYEIIGESFTKEELGGLNTITEQLFGEAQDGNAYDAIDIVKRLVLAPKGEKPLLSKEHPLYQLLYNIGTSLQETHSTLTIKLEHGNSALGKTVLTSTDDFGNAEVTLFLNNIQDSEELVHAIAHELVHAVTGLQLIEDDLFKNDLVKVIREVQDYLNFTYRDSYRTANKVYGLDSVDEFVAEYFSNPLFQEMLKQIPYGQAKPTSAFRRVLHLILRKLFGVEIKKNPSVYDALAPKMERLLLVSNRMDTTMRGSRKQFLDDLHTAQSFIDAYKGRFTGLDKKVQDAILEEMTPYEFNTMPRTLQDCIIACKTL